MQCGEAEATWPWLIFAGMVVQIISWRFGPTLENVGEVRKL